ncbi:transglutaminase family protein [Nitratireductor basaltis]|uniref:Transglutaminase n=1 Tax=Nitratireductor basaltis TaxID=472175 RepID=A0A084UB29_9HYPH|nr:transglutaminase family protein [Nitratireductor basaltis]KFB10165.1 Transglutaminase [Nitratireductor basaltis]
MRLKISHTTEYSYDLPVSYALQRLRLFPRSGPTQKVVEWKMSIDGGREEVRYDDSYGNDTRLLSAEGSTNTISVSVSGVVETRESNGISGPHRGLAPLWLFQRTSAQCEAGESIRRLAEEHPAHDEGDAVRLHGLMKAIGERVSYVTHATDVMTTAEEALQRGEGVCQDHSHIFIAAARLMGYPARYVSGYLRMDGVDEQTASHAWAEAHVDGLGWVGFDCSNGISPDERYVRIAIGRDYREAKPIAGIRHGYSEEALAVHITVEQ